MKMSQLYKTISLVLAIIFMWVNCASSFSLQTDSRSSIISATALAPESIFKPDDAVSVTTDEQTLIDFLARRDTLPDEPVDVLLVLGNNRIETVQTAAVFFKQGRARKIVVSGGVGWGTQGLRDAIEKLGYPIEDVQRKSEAELFREILLYLGVPDEVVEIEPLSTNTKENIINSLVLIREKKIPCASVIIVQHPFLQRRSHATFERWQNVKTKVYSYAPYIPEYEKIPYEERGEALKKVMGEYDRFVKYGPHGSGDIVTVALPEGVRRVCVRMRERMDRELDILAKHNQLKYQPAVELLRVVADKTISISQRKACVWQLRNQGSYDELGKIIADDQMDMPLRVEALWLLHISGDVLRVQHMLPLFKRLARDPLQPPEVHNEAVSAMRCAEGNTDIYDLLKIKPDNPNDREYGVYRQVVHELMKRLSGGRVTETERALIRKFLRDGVAFFFMRAGNEQGDSPDRLIAVDILHDYLALSGEEVFRKYVIKTFMALVRVKNSEVAMAARTALFSVQGPERTLTAESMPTAVSRPVRSVLDNNMQGNKPFQEMLRLIPEEGMQLAYEVLMMNDPGVQAVLIELYNKLRDKRVDRVSVLVRLRMAYANSSDQRKEVLEYFLDHFEKGIENDSLVCRSKFDGKEFRIGMKNGIYQFDFSRFVSRFDFFEYGEALLYTPEPVSYFKEAAAGKNDLRLLMYTYPRGAQGAFQAMLMSDPSVRWVLLCMIDKMARYDTKTARGMMEQMFEGYPAVFLDLIAYIFDQYRCVYRDGKLILISKYDGSTINVTRTSDKCEYDIYPVNTVVTGIAQRELPKGVTSCAKMIEKNDDFIAVLSDFPAGAMAAFGSLLTSDPLLQEGVVTYAKEVLANKTDPKSAQLIIKDLYRSAPKPVGDAMGYLFDHYTPLYRDGGLLMKPKGTGIPFTIGKKGNSYILNFAVKPWLLKKTDEETEAGIFAKVLLDSAA